MGRKRKSIVRKLPGYTDFRFDWTVDGRRFRGGTGEAEDERLAEEIALEERRGILRRLRLGEGGPASADMTISEALVRALAEHWAHYPAQRDAVQSHCRALLRIVGPAVKLGDIDDALVAEFVARRRGEAVPDRRGKKRRASEPVAATRKLVSPATVNRATDALRKVMNLAGDWRHGGLPVRVGEVDWKRHRLREQSREVYLTEDQAARLFGAIAGHARAPIMLALLTGLRRANLLGLDWKDADLPGRLLTVRISARAGGVKPHAVPLVGAAVDLLEGLEPDPRLRRGPVFVFGARTVDCDCVACRDDNRRGRELRGQRIRSIKRAFNTARQAIGQPDLRFHDLRHTVASWLIQNRQPLAVVQEVLGHADIGTTRRYSHLERDHVAAAMAESLGPKVINKSYEPSDPETKSA